MDIGKLTRMANQIAANFAAQGEEAAIASTAEHIWKFWDPRMKAQIYASMPDDLSPIAKAALSKLKAEAEAA